MKRKCSDCKDKITEYNYYNCLKFKWLIAKSLGNEQCVCDFTEDEQNEESKS